MRSTVNKKDVIIAEPMHRVPPPRATSGISLRTFSKSSLEMVREVCFFYVRKCSGKYENNRVAARYVHQMAEEILSLLGGIITEIEKRKEHPEILQSLLDEWNANFPASLRSYGSPKAIASLIEAQSKELSSLRSDLAAERLQRKAAEEQLSDAVIEQLQSYKKSFLVERKERQMAAESAESEHGRELAAMHEKYIKHAAEMETKFLDTLSVRQSEYTKMIAVLEKQLSDANYCQKQMKAEFDEIKLATEEKDKEIVDLSSRLQKSLSSSRSTANGRRSSPHRSSRSPSSSSSSKIFSSPLATTTPTRGSIFSPGADPFNRSSEHFATTSLPAGGDESLVNDGEEEEEEEALLRLVQATADISQKNEEIERLRAKLMEVQHEVLILREHVQLLVPREESLRRELLHIEIMHEKLKKAVHMGLDKLPPGFRAGMAGASGDVVVLCHTPHFLGPPDRNQLSAASSEPKLAGYQTWGKF